MKLNYTKKIMSLILLFILILIKINFFINKKNLIKYLIKLNNISNIKIIFAFINKYDIILEKIICSKT